MNDETRQQVLERDNHECHFCDSKENLHVHHIIPRRADGSDDPWNLKTVCASCHKKSEELHSRGLEKIKEQFKEEKIQEEVENRLEEREQQEPLDRIVSSENEVTVKATVYLVVFYPIFSKKPEYEYVGYNKERALEKLEEKDQASLKKWKVPVDLSEALEDRKDKIQERIESGRI